MDVVCAWTVVLNIPELGIRFQNICARIELLNGSQHTPDTIGGLSAIADEVGEGMDA